MGRQLDRFRSGIDTGALLEVWKLDSIMKIIELLSKMLRADWDDETQLFALGSGNIEIPVSEIQRLVSIAESHQSVDGLLAVSSESHVEILMQRNRIFRPMFRD